MLSGCGVTSLRRGAPGDVLLQTREVDPALGLVTPYKMVGLAEGQRWQACDVLAGSGSAHHFAGTGMQTLLPDKGALRQLASRENEH